VGVGLIALPGRDSLADDDHGPPLCEARAYPIILLDALAQTVEAFGDLFLRRTGQRMRALVDLDAGDLALILDHLDE
jgi:hypothetical protein